MSPNGDSRAETLPAAGYARWRLVALAFSYGMACAATARASEFIRTETAAAMRAAGLPAALSGGTVIARLEPGDALALPAGPGTALEASTLYIAASSEFLSVAVLRGAITLSGHTARAGDLLVRSIAGSRVERFAFDARAFAAATPADALREGERADLRTVETRPESGGPRPRRPFRPA